MNELDAVKQFLMYKNEINKSVNGKYHGRTWSDEELEEEFQKWSDKVEFIKNIEKVDFEKNRVVIIESGMLASGRINLSVENICHDTIEVAETWCGKYLEPYDGYDILFLIVPASIEKVQFNEPHSTGPCQDE